MVVSFSCALSRMRLISSRQKCSFCILHHHTRQHGVPKRFDCDNALMTQNIISCFLCTRSSVWNTWDCYRNLHRSFSCDRNPLPSLSNLQEEVTKIEHYPPGFISTKNPHQRMTKIHKLMEEASSLHSTHGAKLVERLLHKVLSEALLTCHYPAGLVARQRDEEWHKEEEEGLVEGANADILHSGKTTHQPRFEKRKSLEKILNTIGKQNLKEKSQLGSLNGHDEEHAYVQYEYNSQDTFDYYPVYPTKKMYTQAIQAWANSVPKPTFSEKTAKQKNRRKIDHPIDSRKKIKDTDNGNIVSAAMRARELLYLMNNQYIHFQKEEKIGTIPKPSNAEVDIRGTYCRPPQPDCVCFTGVIQAYQKEGNALVAEEILENMISFSSTDNNNTASFHYNPEVRPDTFCFRTVLQAWVEHENPDLGLSKARQLLQKMEDLQKNVKEYEYLKPDTWMYNTYMQALVNRTTPDRVWAAWEVRRILEAMCNSIDGIDANTVSFNLAIHAMAKLESVKGAVQAEKLLDQMFTKYRSLSPLSSSNLKPNSTSFNTVIKAWAGCAKTVASQKNINEINPSDRADKVLQLMTRLYEEDPVEWEQLRPKKITYNSVLSVLSCCAKHDCSSAEKADHLIEMMWNTYEETGELDVQPDNVTYDTVIHALTNTNRYESIVRAHQWLEHMYLSYSKHGETSLRPGIHTIGLVLRSWSKMSRRHPEGALRAQQLLDFVHDQHQRNRRLVSPDSTCYLLTMAAWLKCKSCSSLDRVKFTHDLLTTMEVLYQSGKTELRPTTAHYNIVLNACGLCQRQDIGPEESDRIVALAVRTCQQLRESEHCKADESTYFWILTVVKNLIAEEHRIEYFEELFYACREEGLVSRYIWHILDEIMPKGWPGSLVRDKAIGVPLSYGSVPASWKKNSTKK